MSRTLPLFSTDADGNLTSKPTFIDAKPPTLRPYQDRGVKLLREATLRGIKRILAVGPTGLGKMVMIAAITRMSTIPVLFVAHRRELLNQCADQLAALGLTNTSIIRANDDRCDPNATVQIASIQTLARRDKPFQNELEVLIFIDEAHRAASDSYIEHVFQAYPKAIIIGFTATPVRLDGRPLGGELFEELILIARYEELFKNPDWLVRPDGYSAPVRPKLDQVKMRGSDFDEDELATIMHSDSLEGQVVEHWSRLAHVHPKFNGNGTRLPTQFETGPRRRTFVFAVNIEHSMSLAARFESIGVKVAHLDGKTPDRVRDAIIRDLGTGALEVVCNCNIAVEGVDVPEVKCVVHARPTHSITLWRQTVGRCMRPWKGIVPLLLDHASNWDRLGCPFEDLAWTLKGRSLRFGSKLPMKLCRTCFAYTEPHKVLCPYCGAEFPRQDPRNMPAETTAELVERSNEPEALKKEFFARQVIQAKTHGFKPGFASALYKERYGVWPPKEWSNKIKQEFANDKAWQEAMKRRLEKKAQKEVQEKAEERALRGETEAEQKARETKEAFARAMGKQQQLTPQSEQPRVDVAGAFARMKAKQQQQPVEPKSPEEAAMEKTLEAMEIEGEWVESESTSPFADWLEEQGIG